MTFIKKYLIHLLTTILSIIITLLLLTTLYYFNIINESTYNILKIVILLISIFFNSLLLGRKAKNKGYLEGIKLSLILIVLFLIPTVILSNFNIKVLIYYLIMILTSSLGSMIGINMKKN